MRDVTWVEEHVTNGGRFLVYLEWMPGKYDPLCDDTPRVN